jgi:hypothetical protein
MGKFLITILASICLTAGAQNFTYRFDWQGFSNLFHATFTVSQSDFITTFHDPMFWGTLSVTNPGGRVYTATMEGTQFAEGSFEPGWYLSVLLTDYHDNSQIDMVGGHIYGIPYTTAGFIYQLGTEYGGWKEDGYWSVVQQIPEPSIAALCVVGLLVACIHRRAPRII